RGGEHDCWQPAVRPRESGQPDAQGAEQSPGEVLMSEHTGVRPLFRVVVALALAVPLTAQQPQPQAPPVFRSGAQLTVETVTVKDKSGRPVEGLTAKDLSITEDGGPQTISFVELQHVPNPSARLQASDAVPA